MAKSEKKTVAQTSQAAVDELFDDYFPIPNIVAPDEERDRDVVLLDRERIDPNPNQPRQYFDPKGLKELGESMREVQQLQPIVVRPHPTRNGRFQIVAGERRWRASAPEYGDVPRLRATIRKFSDYEVARIVYEENERREDVSPIARARSLENLKRVSPGTPSHKPGTPHKPATWAKVAREAGLAERSALRLVELLQLPKEAQSAIERLGMSEKHGRALLLLKNDIRAQNRLLREIENEELSGNEAVRRAEALKKPEPPTSGPSTWTSSESDESASRETSMNATSASTSATPATTGVGMSTSGSDTSRDSKPGVSTTGNVSHETKVEEREFSIERAQAVKYLYNAADFLERAQMTEAAQRARAIIDEFF